MVEARRRLAAILAADVAGFSRLMGDDERATMEMLDACRATFRDHVGDHQGRIVDTAGDSVLAVFDSVVEATLGASEIQATLTKLNADLPVARRMLFRIGVNLGDVFEQNDGTIYGDGVNVAARLESLAEPGGICLSASAHEQVVGKVTLAFVDLGQHEVKNIARPVRAYRASLSGTGEPPAESVASAKPSIAVLAFENLSGDADQEFLADGIAEDLITELSRLRWLQVTARNSTFTYKGQAVDVKQVGRELAVRYVVEGSVRSGGERVRITAQLIDAASGNHIWAERYDRGLADIFALQDEVAETLVAALQGEVGEVERERAHRKPPGSLDAWESYQRGLWHLWRHTADDLAEARRWLLQAAEQDANFAQAVAARACSHIFEISSGFSDSPRESLAEAARLANEAVALDDKEALGHFALGRVYTLSGDSAAALAELRIATGLNPSFAIAYFGLANAHLLASQRAEAIASCDSAIRLSPRGPLVWAFYLVRAMSHFMSDDFESALADAQRSIRQPASTWQPHSTLVAALAHLGRLDEARAALATLLELKPDLTPQAVMRQIFPLDPEAARPLLKTWFEGMRLAGFDATGE